MLEERCVCVRERERVCMCVCVHECVCVIVCTLNHLLLLLFCFYFVLELHDMTLSPFTDVKMSGHVTWVGKSSMEVTMTLEQVSVEFFQGLFHFSPFLL